MTLSPNMTSPLNRFGFPTSPTGCSVGRSAAAVAALRNDSQPTILQRRARFAEAKSRFEGADGGQGSQHPDSREVSVRVRSLHEYTLGDSNLDSPCMGAFCGWRDNWHDAACLASGMDHWVGGILWRHLLIWHRHAWLAKTMRGAVMAAAHRWLNRQIWGVWTVLREAGHRHREERMRLRQAALRWISRELGAALSTWTAHLVAVWHQRNQSLKAVR